MQSPCVLVAPMWQGGGATEQESPTGPIRFHQHDWGLHPPAHREPPGLDSESPRTTRWSSACPIPMRVGVGNVAGAYPGCPDSWHYQRFECITVSCDPLGYGVNLKK